MLLAMSISKPALSGWNPDPFLLVYSHCRLPEAQGVGTMVMFGLGVCGFWIGWCKDWFLAVEGRLRVGWGAGHNGAGTGWIWFCLLVGVQCLACEQVWVCLLDSGNRAPVKVGGSVRKWCFVSWLLHYEKEVSISTAYHCQFSSTVLRGDIRMLTLCWHCTFGDICWHCTFVLYWDTLLLYKGSASSG